MRWIDAFQNFLNKVAWLFVVIDVARFQTKDFVDFWPVLQPPAAVQSWVSLAQHIGQRELRSLNYLKNRDKVPWSDKTMSIFYTHATDRFCLNKISMKVICYLRRSTHIRDTRLSEFWGLWVFLSLQ